MNLKAFEPKKVSFAKLDSNMLAQTSSQSSSTKEVKHQTGQLFSPGFHSLFESVGITKYEFEIMDYFVIVIAIGVLIAVIIVACVCFPPYKSEEEWEKIENERDDRDEKAFKKKQEEGMMMSSLE